MPPNVPRPDTSDNSKKPEQTRPSTTATAAKSSPISRSDLTREPEFIEKLFLYLERKNIFKSVSISVKVGNSYGEPVTLNLAYSSLRRLVLKYPLLFSAAVGEEPHIRWQPLAEIVFQDVFQVNDSETCCFTSPDANTRLLNALSVAENHQEQKPLWRLVYYSKTGWVTFHCAHSFTDGGSVIAYLKEFVEGLNHVETGSKWKKVLFNLERDMPLLENGISAKFFDKIRFVPNFRTWITAIGLKMAIWVCPMIVPTLLETHQQIRGFVDRFPVPFSPRTFFESDFVINEKSPLNDLTPFFVNIPPGELRLILKSCRKHEVKLQTYMIFVYVHTVHEMCPDLYSHKFLKIGVPVSLRNRYKCLQSHGTYLGDTGRFDDGFYTFSVKYFIEPHTPFSWESVKKYHDFLHRTMNGASWINQYYVVGEAMNAECFMDPRLDFKRDDCFLASTNLGHIELLDHGESGRFHIENILFAPSSGAMLGTHHMTICSTKKAGLNIGFSDGDRNVKDWGVFRERFRKNLIHMREES